MQLSLQLAWFSCEQRGVVHWIFSLRVLLEWMEYLDKLEERGHQDLLCMLRYGMSDWMVVHDVSARGNSLKAPMSERMMT